ncbi:MAG: dienelactone hydrolase family protein [Candidatus Eisenbacteria bacterium]|nr:dienelactone hydrolase family protein [Candidatus Eisenbacteria bacterium]
MSGRRFRVEQDGNEVMGYLAPASSGRGPGVIVLQEWWGLVPHIESLCDRLAAEGFTCLAPDLYHGQTAKSPDDAGKMMMALDVERTADDLSHAVSYLSSHTTVSSARLGIVGFCMGGQLSLYAACRNPKIGAAVDFYGIHPHVTPDLESLQAAVLGFFGARDGSVPRAVADELEAKLRAAGKRVAFHHYAEAGHAFMNDTRPEVYAPDAARDAWSKMTTFFRSELGSS